MSDKWFKTSEASISNGRFHIARFMSGKEAGFLLWDDKKLIGTFEDATGAKNEADKIAKNLQS